jgi:hypothetical protein
VMAISEVCTVSASEMPWVFRVQDKAGRGPFKPGMSQHWVEDNSDVVPPPPVHEAFGPDLFATLHNLIKVNGGACGCACLEKADFAKWFTPIERNNLNKLGYRLVTLKPDRIVATAPHQVVFWRKRPLNRDTLVIPWSDIAP